MELLHCNACLGISNKKDLITNMINENKIDILCLEEVEIDQKIITNMMSIKNYNIEIERVGYIRPNPDDRICMTIRLALICLT